MNAIDFVKKFGVKEAKDQLENPKLVYGSQVDYQFMNDLKQIVDAFELVEKYNGLNASKNTLKLLQSSIDIGLYHGINGVYAKTEIPKLKQAIELVEKINES